MERQIPEATTAVEKFCGPRGVRAEEQRLVAVDDARIQMRHGHGGRGAGRHAVHFGDVLLHNLRLVADEPLAADGKSAEAFALGDAAIL